MTPQEIAIALGRFPTATIYEAAGKAGDMSPSIRPIWSGIRLAGIAYTVRTFPSDTTAVIRAIDEAPAGSVLVIDAGGTERAAVWGGTSSLACGVRNIVGCVTNGCVRDVDEITRLAFPVFAAGIAPRGTLKSHEGWRGTTISVGGVSVSHGDYIIGDSDGVVVVPAAEGGAMCERVRKQREREEARDARVSHGEPLSTIVGLPPLE